MNKRLFTFLLKYLPQKSSHSDYKTAAVLVKLCWQESVLLELENLTVEHLCKSQPLLLMLLRLLN